MDVDKHAEELASALGVDKQEVKEDLENLLQYSVPIDEAKQSVRRKHGGGGGGDATPESLELSELTTEHDNVTVTVRVLTKGTRSIRYQGEDITIREGEFADETGTVSYTAWQEFGFEPGDTVTVGNAGVREWEGSPELNLGDSTSVALESEELDVPDEIGGERDLIDLEPGDRGRTIEVQVVEVEERTIDGRDGETEILSGVVGDGTGRLPFTDWDPHTEIEEGASVRLEDVYVREYRGAPSVNVSEFSTVTSLEEDVTVTDSAPSMSIGEAVAGGGLFDVALSGNVIEVRDGSGLIQRCPECNRAIQNGECRSHGQVDGEDDLRTKAILDDGTGTCTVILGRELTEGIYGGDLDDAREAAREAMDREVVAEEIAAALVGDAYRARGSLSVDEYGANLNADAFEPVEEEPETAARELLAELGVGA
ncbi:Single-stranded DNA binding protein [Halolamina sp. CBA1230]|uniref:Single-stranded DNA binding protein n=1 Tax=Halolamina sp. CBA1230 TaxID=1853690 RepID=UPI0009A16BED|nr:Single-stranded DNA binding protein [Halolamina sp. CBA1230]QKY19533.1 Single-stranded DNA binding protein [Halolamina sp. CBA1230]